MQTLELGTFQGQLDEMLELVCQELQLTPTQDETATRSYQAVGEFLDARDSSLAEYAPEVFAQGSKELGTTNKPRKREEFDVDLVCLLEIDPSRSSPNAVYEAVWSRLKESDRYRPMLVPKDRCIRIDYAGQFHLDVIPACPSPQPTSPWGELSIVVPDRSRRIWCPTNPRGYAKWFKTCCRPLGDVRVACKLNPLPPEAKLSEKSVLHRVVQLYKRRRDVHFNGDKYAPSSILLTTVDGLLYRGEESVSDAVVQVLDRLVAYGDQINGGEPPEVPNPTNSEENLARQWREDRRCFTAFIEFVREFRDGMERLRIASGVEEIAAILNELFDPTGSGIVKRAVAAYAGKFQGSRERREFGFLPGTSGLVTVAASPRAKVMPANNFFGADDE